MSKHRLDIHQIEELHTSLLNGTPGYLASAKRLLDGGMQMDELLSRLPSHLPSPFEIEWENVPEDSESLQDALAILAYDSSPHSIEELAEITEAPYETLLSQFASCSFVTVPSERDRHVRFITASFRKYAAERLSSRRKQVWNRLASYFLLKHEAYADTGALSRYLSEAERPTDLLALLNAPSFLRLVDSSDSYGPMLERSQIGFDTALELGRYGDAMRFGVQSGIVAEFSPVESIRAELLARLKLGQYPQAIDLAQSTALKTHRLQLLATIGKFQRQQGLAVEGAVLDSITHLIGQINVKEFGDDLLGTASDLMYTKPELAIELISHADQSISDDRALDWTLLRMSSIATKHKNSGGSPASDITASLRSRMRNPEAHNFFGAISALFDGDTSNDVIREVSTIPGATDRIFLLRQWCRNTRKPEIAGSVIDHAVYLTIRTTEYAATARDYLDFARPLPLIESSDQIGSLVNAFDIQRDMARKAGPTADYVHLQLILAEAEGRINPERSGRRLLDIYYEVDQIPDIEVKAVCLAHIVAAFPSLDPEGAFADTKEIGRIAEADLKTYIRTLLDATADHYLISRSVIEALASKRSDLACDVISMLNYAERQDRARLDLLEHILDDREWMLDLDTLTRLVTEFEDSDDAAEAVEMVLAELARRDDCVALAKDSRVLSLIMRAGKLSNTVLSARSISSALVLLAKGGGQDSLIEQLKKTVRERWLSIDDLETRLTTGFRIVSRVAEQHREFAYELMKAVEEQKASCDDSSRGSVLQCVRLAIRAYSGLLPLRLETSQDFERLSQAIEGVDSSVMRIRLWVDFALRCVKWKRPEECKRVTQAKIRPLLDGLRTKNEYDWYQSMALAAPALYSLNAINGLEAIDTLPLSWREDALRNLSRWMSTGLPLGEPYNRGSRPYALDYDTALELLTVANRLELDHFIYFNIATASESASWGHNPNRFTQTQKNTLCDKILELVHKKFPCARGIKHDGFAVLCECKALRLRKEKSVDWTPLIERGRAIPNVSDRVFVLAHMADFIHNGLIDVKRELLEEAYQLSLSIPSARDRMSRIEMLAEIAIDHDKAFARKLLVEASETLSKTQGHEDSEEASVRSMVDIAYQIDPDLAASIAAKLDSDVRGAEARKEIRFQKLKAQLLDPKVVPDQEAIEPEMLANVCWNLLAQLNAGGISARDVESTMTFLRKAKKFPLEGLFPIVAFLIENAIVRRAHADEAKFVLRDVYESMLSTCEIAKAIARRATTIASEKVYFETVTARTLILAGERDKAIGVISDWLAKEAAKFIYVCDPFFGPRDLELMRLVAENKPNLQVTVVTSRKQQDHDHVTFPYDEFYASYWKNNFSEEPIARTDVIVVGNQAGELPIHDRWIISESSGLRLGGSFNGLGMSKDTEISILEEDEIKERRAVTEKYIHRQTREHLGQKLTYTFFELPL